MTKQQKAKLWVLLKSEIIKRDGYKCAICGSSKPGLHMCHIYPEGAYQRMMFDRDNVFLGCYRCHLSFWHKDIIKAYEWYVKNVPLKRRNYLKKMVENYDNLPKLNYEEILKRFECTRFSKKMK